MWLLIILILNYIKLKQDIKKDNLEKIKLSKGNIKTSILNFLCVNYSKLKVESIEELINNIEEFLTIITKSLLYVIYYAIIFICSFIPILDLAIGLYSIEYFRIMFEKIKKKKYIKRKTNEQKSNCNRFGRHCI